jgi:glycosyltransferase involved in cell wall biosynthesis
MRNAGLEVQYIPLALTDKLRWWRYLRAQRELRRVLRTFQPDIVHANDLPTSQMVGQVSGRYGIPRICHHRWMFAGPAIDWLNKFGAELHIFVSHAFMHDMCHASPRLSASARCAVHDAIQPAAVPSEADRIGARQRLGLSLSKRVVLFAGQIIERKGVEDLIRAWKQRRTMGTIDAELVIVGEDLENGGRYRRQMQSLAAELGVPAQFVGFQHDVFSWIVAADFCVVPSYVEPFGLAVLEAMAHARPVIGTRVGGIPEMVIDGETGILVPPHDPPTLAAAMERLLRDSELRLRLGRAGRKRCEQRFSLAAHVDTVVGHYRSVLARQAAVTA